MPKFQGRQKPSFDEVGDLLDKLFPVTELPLSCPGAFDISIHLKRLGFQPGVVTIGYCEFEGKREFHCPEKKLKRYLKKVRKGEEIKIHAWLTFSDMTVLDHSLLATLAYWRGDSPSLSAKSYLYMGTGDEDPRIRLFPVLVGADFLIKTYTVHLHNYPPEALSNI